MEWGWLDVCHAADVGPILQISHPPTKRHMDNFLLILDCCNDPIVTFFSLFFSLLILYLLFLTSLLIFYNLDQPMATLLY